MNGQNEQLEEIFSYYGKLDQPAGQEEVVNMLREIQELCGFISPEMKRRAAETRVFDTCPTRKKSHKSLQAA